MAIASAISEITMPIYICARVLIRVITIYFFFSPFCLVSHIRCVALFLCVFFCFPVHFRLFHRCRMKYTSRKLLRRWLTYFRLHGLVFFFSFLSLLPFTLTCCLLWFIFCRHSLICTADIYKRTYTYVLSSYGKKATTTKKWRMILVFVLLTLIALVWIALVFNILREKNGLYSCVYARILQRQWKNDWAIEIYYFDDVIWRNIN